jgi:hypothetical protein
VRWRCGEVEKMWGEMKQTTQKIEEREDRRQKTEDRVKK